RPRTVHKLNVAQIRKLHALVVQMRAERKHVTMADVYALFHPIAEGEKFEMLHNDTQFEGKSYWEGHFVGPFQNPNFGLESCQTRCKKHAKCVIWEYDPVKQICRLKDVLGGPGNLVEGSGIRAGVIRSRYSCKE
ncbi:hypothetical protein HDU82_002606, partial [Entophlyctis luteolus]